MVDYMDLISDHNGYWELKLCPPVLLSIYCTDLRGVDDSALAQHLMDNAQPLLYSSSAEKENSNIGTFCIKCHYSSFNSNVSSDNDKQQED